MNSRSCTEVVRFASEVVATQVIKLSEKINVRFCFQSCSIAIKKFLENILLAYLGTVLFLQTVLQ